MERRAFLIAAFGNRSKQVQRLIKNIREYSDFPIYILTTKDSIVKPLTDYLKRDSKLQVPIDNKIYSNINIRYIERIWSKGSQREGIRNSNYYKVLYALDLEYNSVCLLDDDMFIMHKGFFEGFELTERFGVALPLNPRIYVGINSMGADVRPNDLVDISSSPYYAPACNFSPFFYCNMMTAARGFMLELKDQLRNNVCRGTLAIWKASWQTGFTPIYLPEQFCVCGSNAEYIRDYSKILQGKEIKIPVMCLHLGHEAVKMAFQPDIEATASPLLVDWTLGQG